MTTNFFSYNSRGRLMPFNAKQFVESCFYISDYFDPKYLKPVHFTSKVRRRSELFPESESDGVRRLKWFHSSAWASFFMVIVKISDVYSQ